MKNPELMKCIPKDFKPYVVNIWLGEQQWNEVTKRWNKPLFVEWNNGNISEFANKNYARNCLNDYYTVSEVM